MTDTKTTQIKKYPFFTRTSVQLGLLDRLRILFRGKLFFEVRSELDFEPGIFPTSSGQIYIPGFFASKPKTMSIN